MPKSQTRHYAFLLDVSDPGQNEINDWLQDHPDTISNVVVKALALYCQADEASKRLEKGAFDALDDLTKATKGSADE